MQTTEYFVDVASVRDLVGDLGQYTLRIDLGVLPPVLIPIVVDSSFTGWFSSPVLTSNSKTVASKTSLQKGLSPSTQQVSSFVAKKTGGTSETDRGRVRSRSTAKVASGIANGSVDAVVAAIGRQTFKL